jgi:hypothetical protein
MDNIHAYTVSSPLLTPLPFSLFVFSGFVGVSSPKSEPPADPQGNIIKMQLFAKLQFREEY